MPGSTPIYGFPYPDPSDLVANYPALGQQLAEDIEDVLPTIGGLAPIAPTTIANSGGTATTTGNTTTFSGVSTLSLNGVFSSTYLNYLVVCRLTVSTAGDLQFRLRVAGSDNATANSYIHERILADGATLTAERTTENVMRIAGLNTAFPNAYEQNIYAPFLAETTQSFSNNFYSTNNGSTRIYSAVHNQSTSYDGFSVFPTGGTITGKISVYGYKG